MAVSKVVPPLVQVRNLTRHFGAGQRLVRAVQDVSFEVARGETLGLVGESGSGKSTTGRLLLRLLEPTSGECWFDGQQVFALPPRQMRALRRQMQIVFQDPYGAFNPRMTVAQTLREALRLRGHEAWHSDDELKQYLNLVQLPEDIGDRYPHEFSGGQRQRIAIARALAVQPSFLVADEPVSALDVSTQAEIVNLLLGLQQRLQLAMLFIAHDLAVVKVVCDRVAVMFGGRILEMAPVEALYLNPLQPYTSELLAAVPEPDLSRQPTPGTTAAGADGAPAARQQGCPYAARCPHTMPVCEVQMPELRDYAGACGEPAPHYAACHWVEQRLPS